MAMSFAGSLSFNHVTDTITGPDGRLFKFSAPVGDELPSRGYAAGLNLYQGPPTEDIRRSLSVSVNPGSTRLQLLSPFAPWDGKDYEDCPILIKVRTLH
jgi:aconitate hydratase